MKKYRLLPVAFAFALSSHAQQTFNYKDPQEKFNLAKEYFAKEQYNLAYPILKELQASLRETDRVNNPIEAQEIEYYTTVAALKQNETHAELEAQQYITSVKNNPRVEMMRFHLAEYYFRKQRFSDAVTLYEGTNVANLSNREIADAKFHQGYSYFTMQQFAQAKPLFNTIRQLKSDSNYIDANYYYGFIAFRDRNYDEALNSFKIVQTTPTGCRSFCPGSSTSAFFWVSTPINLSPGITSSSSALLLGRPTFSGRTVPGNTTMLRIGRIGSVLGIDSFCPLVPVRIVVAVGERSMI